MEEFTHPALLNPHFEFPDDLGAWEREHWRFMRCRRRTEFLRRTAELDVSSSRLFEYLQRPLSDPSIWVPAHLLQVCHVHILLATGSQKRDAGKVRGSSLARSSASRSSSA